VNSHQYIGLDVHKKSIWYCAKNAEGKIVKEGRFEATKEGIEEWCKSQAAPWTGLMEATLFSHWIYDAMTPHAAEMRMGHPAAMKEALATKHKSDRNDARRFAELCRNGSVRTLYVMPGALRALRQQLRVRRLIRKQTTQVKNRMAALLMESGIVFSPRQLHTKRYYQNLVNNPATPPTLKALLRMLRQVQTNLVEVQRAIFRSLEQAPQLKDRLKLLQTIPGVGKITALTWALEIGDVRRFPSCADAVSYCGLVSADNESAGKNKSGPLSKIRNPELQHILIEISHLAPKLYWRFDELYRKKSQQVHGNAATVEVARKMVAYLMAVDRSGQPFRKQLAPGEPVAAASTPVELADAAGANQG